jgi:hypothetical protein
MYWSKTRTHGKPPKALRAHTVNLVGELMYCFGGCDAKTCFNSVLIFDAGSYYYDLNHIHIVSIYSFIL